MFAISCKEESKTTYFSAKLGYENEKVELVPIDSYFTGLNKLEEFYITESDSTGFFNFELENFSSGFYQVLLNNYPILNYDIYLEPNDSIYVEQSSWQDEPYFEITGRGSEKLQYLLDDYQLFKGTKEFYKRLKSDEFSDEMDYKKFIDSIFKPRFKNLSESEINKTNLGIQFRKFLTIQRADFLLRHLRFRNYYMEDEFSYHLPEEKYIGFLDSINMKEDFLNVKQTFEFAENYLIYKSEKELDENPNLENKPENLNLKWKYITEQEPSYWNDALAISTINSFSFGMLEDNFFNDFSNYKSKLDSLFYDEKNKKLFHLNAEPFLKLAPGEQAPNFALPDADGKIHRLSDYKGKIVYIDFWGTWCGPCIAEIPASLVLHEKYKDEPIVFLNVALEGGKKEIEEWREFIAGETPYAQKILDGKTYTGVHLLAEDQFINEEITDYLINFAPTYVLVDQNGKLVNARAPRPKKIEEDINLLLSKMK